MKQKEIMDQAMKILISIFSKLNNLHPIIKILNLQVTRMNIDIQLYELFSTICDNSRSGLLNNALNYLLKLCMGQHFP